MGNKESHTAQRPYVDSNEQFLSLFEQCVEGKLVLDDGRRSFVTSTLHTLYKLSIQALRGNGHCKLLLGPRGIGKTKILKHLQEFLRKYSDMVCVTMNGVSGGVRLPISLIASVVGLRLSKNQEPLDQLEEFLQARNLRVFLVVDDLQEVYKSKEAKAARVIEQLHEIGDSRKGLIDCIIAGSSKRLRKLCFAKYDSDSVLKSDSDKPDSLVSAKYPAYSGIDLNKTKFGPDVFYPLCGTKTFISLYDMLGNDSTLATKAHDEFKIQSLFKSGGNPGLLQRYLSGEVIEHDCKRSSGLLSKPTHRFYSIVVALCECLLEQAHYLSPISFTTADEACRPVSVNSIEAKLERSSTSPDAVSTSKHRLMLHHNVLYEMADAGIIQYSFHGPGSHVALCCPAIFLEYASRKTCSGS